MYIYQYKNWNNFVWNNAIILSPLGNVRNLQGRLIGKMDSLGFKLREEAVLENLTLDVIKSTEIEGEILNREQVRSSIARHLGMDISGLVNSDRYVDGVVAMMLDATQNFDKPLTKKRLFNWHSALFPTGRSGMHKIIVGKWRNDSTGPMRVVSGPMGKERVHYQAPDAKKIEKEMERFLKWFNDKDTLDPVIKSAIAHLWFLTVHPFDDGNGRIARAIADMQLSRADGSNARFYSISAQIRLVRKKYYNILETTQKGNSDITQWLVWYLDCMNNVLMATDKILETVFTKAKFWNKHSATILNERQRLMLNKLLDGFVGKLSSSKWAKITKCSADTALRDIQNLIDKGILLKDKSSGRSTNYFLNMLLL